MSVAVRSQLSPYSQKEWPSSGATQYKHATVVSDWMTPPRARAQVPSSKTRENWARKNLDTGHGSKVGHRFATVDCYLDMADAYAPQAESVASESVAVEWSGVATASLESGLKAGMENIHSTNTAWMEICAK